MGPNTIGKFLENYTQKQRKIIGLIRQQKCVNSDDLAICRLFRNANVVLTLLLILNRDSSSSGPQVS